MLDKRVKDFLLPKRVVLSQNVEDEELLLKEKSCQIGLRETELTTIHSNGFIILDAGKEICGGIRILTYLADKVEVRIRLGESVSESCSELGDRGSCNDHSLRDIKTTLINLSDMEFCQSGFRFVRIDNLTDRPISIKSIYFASVYRDIEYKGAFNCNDELINQIYDTARYTCHLNMQNMLWDGIKRDRLVWIGDTHPEMLTIRTVFGSDSCIEEALDFARDQAPLPEYMNGFPTYSLWWILILKDYYMQNANFEYLKKNEEYLKGLILQLDKLVDEDGSCHLPFYFLDWPTHEKPDELAGVRGLFIWAIQGAKYLFNVLGDDESIALSLLKKLSAKKFEVTEYKQALAMQVKAGIVDKHNAYKFLTKGNAEGMSTFLSYYILSSIGDVEVSSAVDIMKEYYGAMLQRGATTFWEDFHMEWLNGSGRIDELPKENEVDLHGDFGAYCYVGFRHSLCHGWSSGVVPFIAEYILGVKILEAGCKKVAIRPNLANLEYATGKYPTPYGNIEIDVRRVNGEVVTKINAPKEIEIVK